MYLHGICVNYDTQTTTRMCTISTLFYKVEIFKIYRAQLDLYRRLLLRVDLYVCSAECGEAMHWNVNHQINLLSFHRTTHFWGVMNFHVYIHTYLAILYLLTHIY